MSGEITPQGAKNEALEVICATLLTPEEVTIHNVPDILDVNNLIQLLRDMRVKVKHPAVGTYVFQADEVDLNYLETEEFLRRCASLRGSVMIVGPLVARFGKAWLSKPGGDKIGRRRLDTHFIGIQKLGATFRYDTERHAYEIEAKKLKGTYMLLDEASVTGTANILMAAVLADGTTQLNNAAREPEITDLANFLNSCGAKISGQGTSTIEIEGVTSLKGSTYAIMPDRIEAATFLACVGMTGGRIVLTHCPVDALESVISVLESMGMRFEHCDEGFAASMSGPLKATEIRTQPYPGEILDGCQFAPRCPRCRPECRTGTLPTVPLRGGAVRCRFPEGGDV